jgi:hypothetical protein
MVSFTPRSLYRRGKSPFYLLDGRLDGPQRRSGRCEVEKNIGPAANGTPVEQPITRCYTEKAILTHRNTGVETQIITETNL